MNGTPINAESLRCDGRLANEMRNIRMNYSFIDNRIYINYSQGCTSVRTSLLVNKERGQFNVNLLFSSLARNEPLNDRKIYEMKNNLSSIFLPIVLSDNQIEVNVEILEDNGSLFAVIINSISLCLCFCGVTLKDMCYAVNLNEAADLCSEEENRSYNCLVVISPNTGEIYYLECFGRCQVRNLTDSISSSFIYAKEIHENIKNFLDEYVLTRAL